MLILPRAFCFTNKAAFKAVFCAIATFWCVLCAAEQNLERTATSLPLPGASIANSAGIFIGVNKFTEDGGLRHLDYAVDDAVIMAHVCVIELKLMPAKNCWLLFSGNPTSDEGKSCLQDLLATGIHPGHASHTAILSALSQMPEKGQTSDDLALIFVSSHGIEDKGVAYVIPEDGLRTILDRSGIPSDTFKTQLQMSKAGKRIIFLDACREDADLQVSKGDPINAMPEAWKTEFESGNDEVLVTSCDVGQFSFESPELQHGVFSYFLVEAFRGASVITGTQTITLGAVADWTSDKVYKWAKQNRPTIKDSLLQRPSFYGPGHGRGIPLAVTSDAVSKQQRINSALRFLADAIADPHSNLKSSLLDDVKGKITLLRGLQLEILLQKLELLSENTAERRAAFQAYWDTSGYAIRPLRFIRKIVNATTPVGSSAIFTASCEGPSDIEYVWEFQRAGRGPWVTLNVPSSEQLALTNIRPEDAGLYRVSVKASGQMLVGDPATLTVPVPPHIIKQPDSVSVKENQKAAFVVSATGDALQFTWEFKVQGGDSWSSVESTSPSFTINEVKAENAGQYRVTVKNESGSDVSREVTLTVQPRAEIPAIVTQPTDQSVTAGEDVVFTAEASGTPPLTYRWETLKTGRTTWQQVGDNSRELTISSARTGDAGRIRVKVTNAAGSVTSDTVRLRINQRQVTFSLDSAPGVTYSVNGGSIYAEGGPFSSQTRVAEKLPPINGEFAWQIHWLIAPFGFSQVKTDGEIVDIVRFGFSFQQIHRGSINDQ